MAKKYYDGDITLSTDWGGDESTGNLPVIGEKVQKVIKEGINSKVGYVGRVDKTGQGFYVLTRDEDTFNKYLETITESLPFGDLTMDGVNGRFDAPFNYKMNITLINPESGYKSTLLGSTGNVIKFTAETRDVNDTPQGESLTITFKIITEGGVENSFTAIYDAKKASEGIEYNLDGKLGVGQNTVVITAVGMNTGISAMRRVTYRLIDMYFSDKFNMNKRYQFATNGTLAMNIGYSLKGVGETSVFWYFDGNLKRTTVLSNKNPNISNANESFYFTEMSDQWLTPGIHNIQMYMSCLDNDSGEKFYTPIYYKEFIIEKTPAILETPFILRKTSFEYEKKILNNGEIPTIYNAKQYENISIEYVAYYNGKSECPVSTYITYPGSIKMQVSAENLPMEGESFSSMQKQVINLTEQGIAYITLESQYDNDSVFETSYKVEISESDMNITNVTDSLALSLNAFGRSNNSSDRESWEYSYTNEFNEVEKIITEFSKNEYVIISTEDINGNVIPPLDATENNTKIVEILPIEEIEDFKYIKFEDKYYIWTKEFDWSNTSGWHDNKLKLSKGNSITINYKPFSNDKIQNLKERGGTYEFEFETTNVYNDDAVICRICGNNNFAPGISIYASGAELVVSREEVKPEYDENGEIININAGYIKAVSTKYKAEESNRISFVITPEGDKNEDGTEYRDRILKIYVNGELCGAYPYDKGTSFVNDSKITFRGSEESCVNISSVNIYKRALSSNEILNNYIYYRNNTNEKTNVYKRNDIMLSDNDEAFDSDKLKSQLPVMMIYQIDKNQSLDDIHQEKKNKKLTRFFDVVYINIQEPDKNFLIKNAYITPQGTSSMNYPVKNLRLYSGKKDDNGEYYSRMFVGSNIFIDGSPNNIEWDNINLETEVSKKRQYAFKDKSIPVNCWCLKADFAESSSSHNTGTARFWNDVLKSNGLTTKAQVKAAQNSDKYPYDVRTCIDGFPIAVFYQSLDGDAPRFEGKYNFNNDKSTESVFGFTGGAELDNQEVKYFYIGKEKPIIHSETKENGEIEYACSFEEGGYTETPTVDSPLYVSDSEGNWYMLRGKELLDNPKMECWELLNSVNEIALFKTMNGFGTGDGDEKVGIVNGSDFDEAFESRYPDCGDYYHINSLKRFGEWLVSCRYLDIDNNTGKSVPFTDATLPTENYHRNSEGKLSICSLTKQTHEIKFEFPNVNFYKEISYETISSNIENEGYQQITIKAEDESTLVYLDVEKIPTIKNEEYEYLKCDGKYYTWMPSNLLIVDELPLIHETAYDYVKVGEKYYVWDNIIKLNDYHETQWVEDNSFNRALKFAVEKYDHIEMNKMAAYYIYLMRFGGVDQTVKNSMLTTEGPATDDPNSTLPSLWYFINYDNDTILGVKNDGRLVFDPYITRQTKDGTGYVYAGRESTLWNNLEEDIQFMEKVTEIDNVLAAGESNSLYALSYDNAIREYDTNQSDKWCERIYNKDAERKYIQTYVEGWVQKVDKDGSATHVYEDYLYDVQGSRSAHRKWWLGRRFNVFDSRFCNTNFRNSLIKFRSTNLPAGSSFTIKSGEPIFYAWGHDNSVTEMTPTAIQPGDSYTFTTKSSFNIGSYLELMGSANIQTLDLRDCVGALTELDITGCYSDSVGTKMKEILVGDNKRTDLVNISNTSMKFSGLNKATKLEVLDMTNIKNVMSFDGLSSLLNIREVYAKGTSVSNFTFADGAMIEYMELPSTIETLSLTRSSTITYDNIVFEDGKYGKLNNLTINSCSNLMNDPDFIFNWISLTPENKRQNLSLDIQGINWTIDKGDELTKLLSLGEIGTSGLSKRNIRGVIKVNPKFDNATALKLQSIFGQECFKEGSTVYIDAPSAIHIDMPEILWEGERDIRCDIIAVGTSLGGELTVYSEVVEILPNGDKKETLINNTDGIITMDDSTLNNNYVTFNVKESSRQFTYLYTTVKYLSEENIEYSSIFTSKISKRIYPKSLEIITAQDSFTNTIKNNMSLLYTPESINDTNIDGRGLFNVKWEIIDGSGEYENIVIHDNDKEIAQIQAMGGVDAIVTVKASVIRIFDNEILCEAQKILEFKDPNTIVTVISNEPLYTILVEHGIIKEIDGYGKLNKNDASKISMEDLVLKKYTEINKPTDTDNTNTLTLSSIPNEKQENYKYIKVNNKYYKWGGTSIFQNNKTLKSFVEFEWFNNSTVGQKPIEGSEAIFTPDNMFKGCSSLEEIALSDQFKYTANGMFEDCTSLKSIYGASQGRMDDNGNLIYTELSIEDIGANFAKNCSNLVVCVLSQMVTHIGIDAFANCIKLTNFEVPSNKILKIDYDNSSTPFTGCYNINFTGSLYEDTSDIKIRVKDNACYEIIDDYTVRLIHMGKDSLVSNIPIDKTVYACAHSMEYRSSEIEPDIIVPSNIIFDGDRIFNNSNGNSIRLECLLTSNCHYLFFNTKYNGNYTFAYGETKIPQRCFSNSSDFEKIILPEGIKHIYSGAFYGCGSLKEIILPSTLNEIETQVFWLTNLQKITFNSEYPPILQKDLFYGNMPEAIYVNPEFYENFKNGIYQLYSPFVTPIKLYNEGYVRIIKDGNIVFLDEDNIVKVGNIDVTQVDDYMKYVTEQNIVDLKVYLNNEVIGEISDKYTTIYLGDNSSLFSGNGYNFRYGVYDDTIQSQLNENGWFYDKRFEGIRSNPNINSSVETEISLKLENYSNKLMPIKYGMYSQLSSNQYGYGYFKNSNKEIILKNTVLGYNIENTITTTDGNAIVGFYGDITKTGINGIVLHEMGESIYSDPIINSVNMLINDENMFKFINVNLIAPHEIPNNVYVTLTDNKSHIYRKLWENEIITFVVPNGYDFVVYASDFITENGKEYFIPNEILVEDNNINLVYETKKGIEIKNNILGYYTNDTDWYVNLDLLSGEWGDVNIPEVSTSEILLSDSNGLTNTEIISKINTDSIFENSINFNKFEKGVKGYIPSYIELEIFNQYLPEINEFLHDNGRNILNTEKLWVSESFDETNAWCSDGNIYPKTTVLNYYIFGKKIMF